MITYFEKKKSLFYRKIIVMCFLLDIILFPKILRDLIYSGNKASFSSEILLTSKMFS